MIDMSDPNNALAIWLLLQFAKEKFPSPDPKEQVECAFTYADLIIKYKQSTEHQPEPFPNKCPKCGNNLKRMDESTLENPLSWSLICLKEGCGYKWSFTDEKTPKNQTM